MKEHPILFSPPMIKAILSGSKTQTRRAVQPPVKKWGPPTNLAETGIGDYSGRANDPTSWGWPFMDDGGDISLASFADIICPYGKAGEHLWVREAWHTEHKYNKVKPSDLPKTAKFWFDWYMMSTPHSDFVSHFCGLDLDAQWAKGNRRPSIFLPRWASRIILEITDVRVERLQDITEADAVAEGCSAEPCDHVRQSCEDIGCWGNTAKGDYGHLWEQINGDGSWATNPWVWAIEFKRVSQ